jgi:hypothetical protein
MKVEQIEGSETSEQKIHAPANHPPKKNTAFTKRQKFSIQNHLVHCSKAGFGISDNGQK